MSSDYEWSDGEHYDDEDMFDAIQEDDVSDGYDDMDADEHDFKAVAMMMRKSYEIDYLSLSQREVEKRMQEEVDYICNILGVEASTASLLLRHMAWNRERLVEKYMDNPSKVLVEASVALPSTQDYQSGRSVSSLSSPSSAKSSRVTRSIAARLFGFGTTSKHAHTTQKYNPKPDDSEPFTCPICFDDSEDIITLSLDCGHPFCTTCWNTFLASKIRDEGEHSIRCMAEGCQLIATDPFIRGLLLSDAAAPEPDPEQKKENARVWARFQELLIRNFVGSKNDIKYCPYPGCTNTVSCQGSTSKFSLASVVPTVSCGARGIPGSGPDGASTTTTTDGETGLGLAEKEHKFCFGCTIEDDHRPVVCAVAKLWLKKCSDDSETANWIKTNTKECPSCESTIEKNGGCNHMTCRKCNHHFCWVCMKKWSNHGSGCNRYVGVDARDAQSKSRASLERYLHYYNRWANHEQSSKLSRDLYATTERKMEDMRLTSSLTWIEVQFMKKAVEEVEKCRMTLKWTYAMAYYLSKDNEKVLFEDNQRDLEKAVEDLSELLEMPVEPENITPLRRKVTDKTAYVQKRNEIVLEDTANGFQDGRWRWNVAVEGFDEPDASEMI